MNFDDFHTFLKTVLPDMGYRWRRFDRRNTRRRIRLRMESLGIHELGKYTRLAVSDTSEQKVLDQLLRLTITRFFRNKDLWAELEDLITQAGEGLRNNAALKIWSAGCAGGEEPFSIAILLDDLCRSGRLEQPWNILGTDTDPASLGRAEEAVYKWGSVREVPEHLLQRWFTEEKGVWTLDQGIRGSVEFKEHDIVMAAPPGRFHLVFLRNSILTYNIDEVQRTVLEKIRECLLEPGLLVIGRTEKLPEDVGFEEVSKCIYRKT